MVLQKKAIRAVNNLGFNSHTSEHFKSMGCLRLGDLYKLRLGSIMYKTIILNNYPDVGNRLQLNSTTHAYSTRTANLIRLPLYRKSKSQRSFLYRGILTWNEFSQLADLSSLRNFKKSLTGIIFNNY